MPRLEHNTQHKPLARRTRPRKMETCPCCRTAYFPAEARYPFACDECALELVAECAPELLIDFYALPLVSELVM